MSVTIRPPADNERSALEDVWVRAWRDTFPEIDFEARRPWLRDNLAALEAKGACLIAAFVGAAPAGFVIVDPATGWLDQIAIDPAHFGGGIGAALMAQARAIAPGRIGLDVNADNVRAIRFYRREGFVKTGEGRNPLSGRATETYEWRDRRPHRENACP